MTDAQLGVVAPTPAAASSAATPTGEMASRLARLRTRAAAGSLDRLLLIIGGVLLPLGLLLIVLAWLGASHTVLLFEQIPYMISGGLLGLGLVFIGGFVYFTYWQTILVRESREQSRRMESVLERIETLLSVTAVAVAPDHASAPYSASGRPGSDSGRAPTARRTSASAPATFLATPTGTMLHRPECQVVAGRTDLKKVKAGSAGYEPCRICRPDLS